VRTETEAFVTATADAEFTEFFEATEPRLRRALVGLCGPENARDALADAMTYAWQHWDRVRTMQNPAGYLYKVARSRARPRRTPPVFPAVGPQGVPEVEPALPRALARLSERQRMAVFLVHACEWSHPEVAELLGVSVSTVRNHLARGLARLRELLEVSIDG
jgi:DNA-directed RNA polymerase specialized sigma24 family protein